MNARTLIGALAWRARQEGLRYLLAPIGMFAVVLAIPIGLSAAAPQDVNSGQVMAQFAERYGAHADAVTLGIGLLLGPGLVALFCSLSVIMLVRNLVGSEASRGGLEALLTAPYTPATVMRALLGYVGAIAVLYWAVLTLLVTLALAIVTWSVNGASVSLTASYLIAALAVPLLAAWAATGLALLVHLLYPRLAQAGSYGINTGGGGIGSLPAMLPGLGVLLTFTLWGTHVGAVELLASTGGAAAVVAVAGVAIVARRFRPDYIL
jgi:hypothetical protein